MMYLHKAFGMDKGYIVIAQNNDTVDYLQQAYALALNLKLTQSKVNSLTVCVEAKTKKLIKAKHTATKITGTVAKPSRPSVRFTALDEPTITNTEKGIKNQPKFIIKFLKQTTGM